MKKLPATGMPVLTACFISGTAAFRFFTFFPVSISALCIAAIFWPFRKQRDLGKTFTIICAFSFGLFYSHIRQETIQAPALPDAGVSLEGNIIDVPEVSNGKLRFTLGEVFSDGVKIEGKVRLFVSQGLDVSTEKPLSCGDRISAFAKLKAPTVLHNPGVYSYDPAGAGIAANGTAKYIRVIRRGEGPASLINQKRRLTGDIIDHSLSMKSAAFHKAIIAGLTGGITQEMRDSFSATGLAHLLSISGTHFGLLAFIIFKAVRTSVKCLPVRPFTRMTLYLAPTQLAVLGTLPVLLLYAALSGMSIPTVRSLVMVFIYMIALFLGRKGQWLNSLSIAALIILMWQPEALFELSFQLSFIAVLSIGHVAGTVKEQAKQNTGEDMRSLTTKIIDKLKPATLMTGAAIIGTAPLAALAFQQFPVISPVTNLLLTPFVCFIILPLGFFTAFYALMFRLSVMPLSGLTDAITLFALRAIDLFSQIPYSSIHVPGPSIALVLFYFLSLLFVIKNPSRWKLFPFALVIITYLTVPHLPGNGLRITFLDVGQGDSSVIRLPDKKTMLIDGGGQEPDMGRRVVAPYLWSQGTDSIDYLVLSHPDSDHYGGLIFIMDNFRIGEVWTSGRKPPGADRFFRKVSEEKIPCKTLKRGDFLEADGYSIYVFHPYDDFYADSPRGEASAENSESLVMKIVYGGASVLFTGDIEEEAEWDMLNLGQWLKSDIIKVPHHGSRTSSSPDFLKTVKPRIAIVSAGQNNSFGHPHTETNVRYKDAGVKLFRTDIDGAVTIIPVNKTYEVKTYRDSTFKKVGELRDEIRNLKIFFMGS
ncbi:MAG: DNA internalization-related competence protein ComEC/Rec2 [Nitrospiraceae bacterium]|nr:MAG: DNA internalization-related competence protein ComEC/Rec2 [Nitrospiraceae bacterium]